MSDDENGDDVFKVIEQALNNLAAENHVQNAMLLAVMGQVAGGSQDWRDRVEVMRSNVETALANHEFDQSSGDLEPFRNHLQLMAKQRFDELFAALKRREDELGRNREGGGQA